MNTVYSRVDIIKTKIAGPIAGITFDNFIIIFMNQLHVYASNVTTIRFTGFADYFCFIRIERIVFIIARCINTARICKTTDNT